MRHFIETLLRINRYPIRMAASAVAALCLVWLFTDAVGRSAAVIGALSGLVIGEVLGRSRLRGGVLLAVGLLGGLAVFFSDWLIVDVWLIPALTGPTQALHLSALVAFGGGALLVAGGLRAAAIRMGAGQVVEAGVLAGAVAFAFAAHRDGAIARPLWLSDRAWDWGLDPITVIMLIGAVFSVILTTLLLLESKRRLPLIASMILPILAFFVLLWTDPASLTTPPQVSDLSDIQDGFGGGDGDNDELESPAGGQQGGSADEAGGEAMSGGSEGGSEGGSGGGQGGPQEQGGAGQPGGEQPTGGVELGEDGQPASPDEGGGSTESSGGEGDEPSQPQDILDESNSSSGRPQPVAVVLLGDDYSPPSEGFYLRQEPMSKYNGTRLVQAERLDIDTDALDHFPPAAREVTAPPSEHRVEIQGTVSLLTEHTAPFGIEAPIRFAPTRNPHPTRFVRTYSFSSLAQSTAYAELLGHEAGSSTWSDAVWEHYTESPDDPRYEALARQLIAELPEEILDDPFAQALKIKLHIDENMRYTRSERHDDAPDPTADFLFGNFTGYCVHSAHAAAYLWRSVGLPARIGTGYLVEESERRGSALMVMNDAAHAWPELYLKDVGWVVLDIAPSESLDPPREPMDDEMLTALADLAREQDEPDQREPIDYSALWDSLLTGLRNLALVLSLSFLVVSYGIKLWRRLRPAFASGRTLSRVGYRAALDRLAEAGLRREVGETRERFARRVALVSPSFATLTTEHIAAAMSDPSRSPPLTDFKTHSRAIRRELRGGTRWWRRVLGLINPISFFWSR